jgi:hypothetical protein
LGGWSAVACSCPLRRSLLLKRFLMLSYKSRSRSRSDRTLLPLRWAGEWGLWGARRSLSVRDATVCGAAPVSVGST